ncbi:peptidoglycan-binding protein [Oscillatoria salina]|uniref:peptidoglycan-binding protein n=1 Tax=Oscillatoria salina TaxID=331517 RepID=UPI0013BCFA85|nr:peptidoglycan-binding protein [Oscillatoria salina]MBZ8180837.1 SH3 domain-containing protein [Oscillatoria salina IIICB1]NET90095.1 SH3 domain-containing protein [Kamptonema sp. SIO1D9]
MESLAYLHLAEAYEDPNLETLEIVLFKGWDWQKINSRSIQIVSLLLAISLISLTNAASALQRGDRGSEVTRLQNALKQIGLFPTSVRSTGYYGEITEKAVRDFQQAIGLIPVDGIAGPQTLSALYDYGYGFPTQPSLPTTPQYIELRPGSQGSEVIKLQEALREQGYYPRFPNGSYDYLTEEAVRNYQSGINLTPTGIADRYTLALLYGNESESASAPIREVVVNSDVSTVPRFPYPVASIEQPPVFSSLPNDSSLITSSPYCRRVETISGRRLNRRSQPTTASAIIGKIPNGSIVEIANLGSNGWVPLRDGGYVSADYLKQCL